MRRIPEFWRVGAVLLFTAGGTACTQEAEQQAEPQAGPQAVAAPVDEIQVVIRGIAETSPPEFDQGKALFTQTCSACHGPAGDGTTQGPPLVHIIYEPSHHADAAFLLAARNGVRAHHWRFGDMPALPDVTEETVMEIVGYIRWLQRQVGIE